MNVSDLNGLALDYWVARSLHDFVREIYFTDSGETVAVRGNDRARRITQRKQLLRALDTVLKFEPSLDEIFWSQ